MLINRNEYMDKLIKLKDTQIIKIITGVRRCGKSTLLDLYKNYLKSIGIKNNQIISLNFENLDNEYLLDYKKLHSFVKERLIENKMNYIFLDEIQLVPNFQKAIDSLFILDNVDLYITGSNANMLSSELSTLLSGRYIEISMLPLSFKEYYEIVGGDKNEAFTSFLRNGGFPFSTTLTDSNIITDYLYGIYNTVLLKDIVTRKKIHDVSLLELVIKYLFENIGNIVSAKKIADTLTSYGRKTTPATVDNYINALLESFIMYKADRYDVKGKQILKSLEKYYLVDLGFRRIILGDKLNNIGFILENIVYLELLRRGYNVFIGKFDNLEIDFIAQKNGEIIYYQISASIIDPNTFQREINPLLKIKDNYPKYIITMDNIPINEDGIKQINIIDFLLNE